ncbi:hypothetical protein [Helicobacter valdiviensis]|uniref:hypothetical protein n=1 Tax=Helicobacter valdiviensis TaxID=1458358 RepID=UPI001FEC8562|nr:hypothetical protein [Helicobacter valdiviensis]
MLGKNQKELTKKRKKFILRKQTQKNIERHSKQKHISKNAYLHNALEAFLECLSKENLFVNKMFLEELNGQK